MIRLVVADDQALVREGLCALLGCYDDLQVVAQVPDGTEVVQLLADGLAADVLLLDVRMPRGGALHTLGELGARGLLRPTLLLTTFDDPVALRAGLERGAKGCLLKDVPVEQLVAAIRLVAAGERYVPMADRRPRAPTADGVPLTRREEQVLRQLCEGSTNRDIAGGLGLTEVAVKMHVRTLCAKLGAANRTQAAIIGMQSGLV